jgi:hypothetical protein
MALADGYALFGVKPGDHQNYNLGWVNIHRDGLVEEPERMKALTAMCRFATGRAFADGEIATDLSYVWAYTSDLDRGVTTYYSVPNAVNHPSDVTSLTTVAPTPNETVSLFLANVVKLLV